MAEDKGMSKPFKFETPVGDYVNIGVPKDGMGYDIEAQVLRKELTKGGNANYTEAVQKKYGKDNQL